MRTAKISELKARLSAHIAYVKRGEDVLILDRETPVAKLVAIDAGSADPRRRRLVAKGLLIPPKARAKQPRFLPRPAGSKPISRETIARVWDEERGTR